MKVKDEQAWLEQLSEFKADEMSRKFSEFLVFWTDAADTMLCHSNEDLQPYEALSKAFEVAEQTFGYLSVEWLGQMLLVIVQHWFQGDCLWESLSLWEQRMVEQATALKIVELQALAEGGPPVPPLPPLPVV
jgi:hypothetical protein